MLSERFNIQTAKPRFEQLYYIQVLEKKCDWHNLSTENALFVKKTSDHNIGIPLSCVVRIDQMVQLSI